MYYISHVGDIGNIDDNEDDDDYDDYDDCDKLVHHNKVLNDFEPLVLVRNNNINMINDDKRKHKITLLVDDYKIFICRNDLYYINVNGVLKIIFYVFSLSSLYVLSYLFTKQKYIITLCVPKLL